MGAVLAGCVSFDRLGNEDFDRYVEFCRETAMTPVDTEDPNDPMSKVDWMVGASATTQEFNKEYKIVYADGDYLSFYAKEYSHLGGAHGNTIIRVGTISRATGRALKVSDFVADEKRAALKNALHDGAVKALGGKENLQSEVDVVENFYLAKDGLHFVEVKSRVAPVSANPEENVGYRKQMKIAKAAQLYLHSVRKKEISSDIEVFFDVISVIFEGEKTSISFFPEAYVPIYT